MCVCVSVKTVFTMIGRDGEDSLESMSGSGHVQLGIQGCSCVSGLLS